MTSTTQFLDIFNKAIADYHKFDDVNHPCENPYDEKTIEWYLDNRDWWEEIISGEYQNYYARMYCNR